MSTLHAGVQKLAPCNFHCHLTRGKPSVYHEGTMKFLIQIPDEVIRERGAEHYALSAQRGARRQGGVQGLLKSDVSSTDEVSSTGEESLTIKVIEPYKP